MTIYCTYLGNKDISIEGSKSGIKELYTGNDVEGLFIEYQGKHIFIGCNCKKFEGQSIDAAFIDIQNQTIEESLLLARKLKAKIIVPIGRLPGYEGHQTAIEFSGSMMLHKLGVPKLLMPGQYLLL